MSYIDFTYNIPDVFDFNISEYNGFVIYSNNYDCFKGTWNDLQNKKIGNNEIILYFEKYYIDNVLKFTGKIGKNIFMFDKEIFFFTIKSLFFLSILFLCL